MPRYFSDLDDGKMVYVDQIGTEIDDEKLVPREAVGFLATYFKDTLPDDGDRFFIVNVRNDAGRIVHRTTLTMQSDWLHAEHGAWTSARKQQVVLVVEDDVLTRMSAVEMVSDAGFDALEAENADEAVAILEARPDVCVVFADIRMPESMDGLKFVRHVKRKWPPLKIIATSAHFNIHQSELPEGGVFLPKPYTVDSVSTALRVMMGGREQTRYG
jgi:CheY-like chemotaxis protein